jgi:hypothetical protein
MAKVRLDYLNAPPQRDPAPGTLPWCAARLESVTDVIAKYKLLTGRNDLDALLAREESPYMRYRLDDDREPLVKALRENAEALGINFPGYTSEVRYTDRVLRFPTLFAAKGIVGQSVPAIRVPNPAVLYSSATGDPGTPEYFPMNAVRWLTPPRDIAALVHCDRDKLHAELFHFGDEDRPMGAEFYLLQPGAYVLTLAVVESGAARQIHRQEFAVTGPRTRVAFTLPARKSCLFRVKRQ